MPNYSRDKMVTSAILSCAIGLIGLAGATALAVSKYKSHRALVEEAENQARDIHTIIDEMMAEGYTDELI